jgi:hypothetical protein
MLSISIVKDTVNLSGMTVVLKNLLEECKKIPEVSEHELKVLTSIYERHKTAMKKGLGANLSRAIHTGSISSGHYWMMWLDVPEELRNAYLEKETLPSKRKMVNALQVEKLHPVTNEVIHRYISVSDVIKEHPFSRNTLYTAIECNMIAKGYKWRFVKE